MNSKLSLFFVVFVCFLVAQSNSKQNIITVIATTNVHGEVDPCG